MFNRTEHTWRLAIGFSGLLLFIAGPQHPRPDTSTDFYSSTATMLADQGWVPSHSLMLASFAFLLIGLLGLLRSGQLSGRLTTVTKVAVAGAVLAVVEMGFHLAAVADIDALRTSGPTPILNTHLALAVVAYPLLGLPVAVLAWLGGTSRVLTHPVFGAIGTAGGVLHAIAGPIVVISKDQHFSFLFQGAILLAIWLVVVGIGYFTTAAQRKFVQT